MEGNNLLKFVKQLTDVKKDYEKTCLSVKEANERNEELNQVNHSLEREVMQIQETINRVSQHLDITTKRKIDLTTRLHTKEIVTSRIFKSLEKKRKELLELRNANNQLSSEWLQEVTEFSSNLIKDGHLKSVKSDIFKESVTLKEELEKICQTTAKWRQAFGKSFEENKRDEKELEDILKQISEATNEIQNLKNQYSTLQNKARSHIIEQKERMDKEEKNLKELDKQIKSTEDELQTVMQEHTHWNRRLTEKAREENNIRLKHNELKKRLQYLERQVREKSGNGGYSNHNNGRRGFVPSNQAFGVGGNMQARGSRNQGSLAFRGRKRKRSIGGDNSIVFNDKVRKKRKLD